MRPRRILAAAALGALLVAGFVLTAGPPPPSPTPAGAFAFAALGDAPYDPHEELRHRLVLRDLAAHDLAWVLHVGDPLWRPCADAHYREVRRRFDGLPHPVVYTPGDNEWTDCWEQGSGGYAPRERLGRLREIFFDEPGLSLGGRPMELVSQAGRAAGERGGGLAENARWERDGVVAATVHLVGSHNALAPFPGRTAADDEEVTARTAAAAAWTREAFAAARAGGASAVVLGFHGSPGLDEPPEDRYRRAYDPFLAVLEEETERFHGRVLVIHGDDHEFTVDRPLTSRATGRHLSNLSRLEVPGSPDVGWVRVVVTPGAADPFAFEERTVPRWKHW